MMNSLINLPIKSIGKVTIQQTKKAIQILHFPSYTQNLLYLITSPYALKELFGNLILINSTILQAKNRTIGAQQRQLMKPRDPILIYSKFCPWLFKRTRERYYLLNWGVLSTLRSPMSEAENATTSVYLVLKMLMTKKATLRTVSIMYVAGMVRAGACCGYCC